MCDCGQRRWKSICVWVCLCLVSTVDMTVCISSTKKVCRLLKHFPSATSPLQVNRKTNGCIWCFSLCSQSGWYLLPCSTDPVFLFFVVFFPSISGSVFFSVAFSTLFWSLHPAELTNKTQWRMENHARNLTGIKKERNIRQQQAVLSSSLALDFALNIWQTLQEYSEETLITFILRVLHVRCQETLVETLLLWEKFEG